IDFRNVHDALLAMLPVAIGFSVTFAIMQLFGMQINPANIIVLPLMFGIGVDSGVHVLHRYRQHPEDDPPGLTQATGKGITITTLTTVIGFACMMLASHRGIRSLGFVVSLGLVLTLLSCWTVMPAWLVLTQRIRAKKSQAH
ncbi:MAG: MMPL family transporter, partial [Phycisphaeraceae bacterium JB051]